MTTGETIMKECVSIPSTDSLVFSQELSTINRVDDEAFSIPLSTGNLEVYALPVGQGDCTIIQCPSGSLIVNDCGSSSFIGPQLSAQSVQAFLGDRIEDVTTILISHPDRDHSNYLFQIAFDTASIQNVIIGATLDDYRSYKPIFNWLTNFDTMNKLRTISNGASCIGTCTVTSGTNFCDDTDINFNILAANVGSTDNQKSIVMKVSTGDFSMLLPGDMEGSAATTIANNPAVQTQLSSLVYKMAHHGASTSANKKLWLERIKPRSAFASSAYNFGNCRHPRCETINRILALGTILPSTPHISYCGNNPGDPTQMAAFCHQIYQTTPSPDTMCILTYSSTLSSSSNCVQVTEVSEIVGDSECPTEFEDEDESGAPPLVANFVVMVMAFILPLNDLMIN